MLKCSDQIPKTTAKWVDGKCIVELGATSIGRVTVHSAGDYDEDTGILTLTNLSADAESATVHYSYDTKSVLSNDVMTVTLAVDIPEKRFIAAGTCGDNLTWILDKDGTLTISGTGDMTDPAVYTDVSWYQYCEDIKKVVIESGVTSIGDFAFISCKNMTDVTIPEGVTSIGTHAFEGCSSLTNVTLPASLKTIEESAFITCSGLTDINIPDGVTTIGNSAFMGCLGLSSVTIPASVTTIGDKAFYLGKFTEITFEHESTDNLTIGENAFKAYMGTIATTVNVPYANVLNPAISGYDWESDNRQVSYVSMNETELWLLGDVTHDGEVDSSDALQIQRYAVKLSSLFDSGTDAEKAARLKAANVTYAQDGDKNVDSADALQIQRKAVGLPSVFDVIK